MARAFLGIGRLAAGVGLSSPSSATARLAVADCVFEVYASETVLASAARRAALPSSTSKGVINDPLFVLEVPTVTSASDPHPTAPSPSSASASDSHSTAPSPSSASASASDSHSTAPSPSSASASAAAGPKAPYPSSSSIALPSRSGSLLVALYANEWIRASLGATPSVPSPPNTTGLSALPPGDWESFVFVPSRSAARAAVSLPPYGESLMSSPSVPRSRAYSTVFTHSAPRKCTTIDELLSMLRTTALTVTQEMIFREMFNERYRTFRVEDVLHFLGGRDYPFEDLLRIQKKLNFIAGPHKERMHLMANEGLACSVQAEVEKSKESPLVVKMDTKLDVLMKKVDACAGTVNELSDSLSNKRSRGLATSILGYLAKILFGGGP